MRKLFLSIQLLWISHLTIFIIMFQQLMSYQTRSRGKFLHMSCRTECFANLYFPYTIKEWNDLSVEIWKSVQHEVFKNQLLKFLRPNLNSLFNVPDSLGIKLLTRLRLSLSHLWKHKSNQDFQGTINPLCSCSLEAESTSHFFLHYPNSRDLCKCLMREIIKIDSCTLGLDENSIRKLLLHEDGRYDNRTNISIISASITFICSSRRFDGQLMWFKYQNICLRCLGFIISTNQISKSCLVV